VRTRTSRTVQAVSTAMVKATQGDHSGTDASGNDEGLPETGEQLMEPVRTTDGRLVLSERPAAGSCWTRRPGVRLRSPSTGYVLPVSGEALHQLGAEGTRRAKKWLDATTRVKASWTNEDATYTNKLEFAWPFGGQSFSFDLGGILTGGDFEGHFFLSEVKKYSSAGDQGAHWDNFLAKCYVARRTMAPLCDHFMWITWHPFRQNTWTKLASAEQVRTGLLLEHNRKRALGKEDEDEARALIDDTVVAEVAERVWLLVLSDKQESLVITPEHRGLIVAHQVEKGLA